MSHYFTPFLMLLLLIFGINYYFFFLWFFFLPPFSRSTKISLISSPPISPRRSCSYRLFFLLIISLQPSINIILMSRSRSLHAGYDMIMGTDLDGNQDRELVLLGPSPSYVAGPDTIEVATLWGSSCVTQALSHDFFRRQIARAD